MLFDAFWRATGEGEFDDLTASCMECYRLSIETSLAPQHCVYRLQRGTDKIARFVAHFFECGTGRDEAGARTYEMMPELPLWIAFDALLAAARFWELPTLGDDGGLDGATYTLEAWKTGQRHKVVRWLPSPIFSGGELIAVITDFLGRLGELAILEGDAEIRARYVPEYVPVRMPYPQGNLA